MSSNSAELVFIPAPGIGHLVPTVLLAKLLLDTNNSISVTILVITLPHSSKLNDYVESQSRDNLYSTRLIFKTLPLLTNPPDPSSPDYIIVAIDLHKPLVKAMFDDRVRAGSPKPVGFVVDMFCTTFVDIADELGVASYVFFTSGAAYLSFVFWAQEWADGHGLQARDFVAMITHPDASFDVPGFRNPVTRKNIPPMFEEIWATEMILNFGRQFKRVKGILVNSYLELEPLAFRLLQNNKSIPPVYPVGPIVDLGTGGGSQHEEKESIMKWLDCQPESSVVFLCFGSLGSFDEEQVKAIANGLDQSGYRFLWALRKPPSAGKPGLPGTNEMFSEALPEGFMDRTAKRGKIIGWAPQVDVLAHPAVGGFVSHCGWNSTLESLWSSVSIAAWPMYAEQQLNAFELVEELRLAVKIRMDYSMNWMTGMAKFIVKDMEIENGIKKLMTMDDKMKGNVKEMSDKARKALKIKGSSYESMSYFLKYVLNDIV